MRLRGTASVVLIGALLNHIGVAARAKVEDTALETRNFEKTPLYVNPNPDNGDSKNTDSDVDDVNFYSPNYYPSRL